MAETGGQRPRTGSELGLIAQNLDPALWGVSLPSIFSSFGGAGFWIGVPQIALVNVVSPATPPWSSLWPAVDCRRHDGRGASPLAPAPRRCCSLPSRSSSRRCAYPYVKLIGGLALIYIAIKLLVQRSAREEAVAAATNLSAVVRIVLTADIILGLDNVIALAGIARGNFALLVVGLAISLPIILAGAAFFMKLLDRFPFLATLLGWVGGNIIANDSAVSRALTAVFGEEHKQLAQTAAAGAGALLVVVAGAVGWRRCKSKSRVDPRAVRLHENFSKFANTLAIT
jgi:hypothetical protein